MFEKAIQEMYSFQYHSPRPDLAKVGSQSVEMEEIGKKTRNFDYRKDDRTTYDIPVMLW
eukprot:CAMPEP_0114657444 /NCGR_PEP_ID=MMETSP0191-20121206/13944_1 /TAXON_ID=126664 /ORGANISM="Sorites sp." /LENGTH=58 /DNA_ID=CAMNT_0001876853 /DNA_START=534 /DNA_END=707 /DNA_ORIENTATION=-